MLLQLVIANLKMLLRNRQALFWALVFPLIFVAVFGLFNVGETPTTTVGLVDNARDQVSTSLVDNLSQVKSLTVKRYESEDAARAELKDGDLRYLLVLPSGMEQTAFQNPPATVTFVYDESSASSAIIIGVIQQFLSRANIDMAQAPTRLALKPEGVIARRLDYFDFLLPGFVAMGVMNYSIIGLGSVIALYREQKILKRILATPLRVQTFFLAQVLAYLVLSLVQAAIIMAAGMAAFGGTVVGGLQSFLSLGALVLLGNLVFLNIGFVVGAYSKSVQAASGLGNAVTLPLMFFSGVFFPTDGLPQMLREVVRFLPLSPFLEAMRGVALDAQPLWQYPGQLALLAAWIAVTAFLAVRTFRFG